MFCSALLPRKDVFLRFDYFKLCHCFQVKRDEIVFLSFTFTVNCVPCLFNQFSTITTKAHAYCTISLMTVPFFFIALFFSMTTIYTSTSTFFCVTISEIASSSSTTFTNFFSLQLLWLRIYFLVQHLWLTRLVKSKKK